MGAMYIMPTHLLFIKLIKVVCYSLHKTFKCTVDKHRQVEICDTVQHRLFLYRSTSWRLVLGLHVSRCLIMCSAPPRGLTASWRPLHPADPASHKVFTPCSFQGMYCKARTFSKVRSFKEYHGSLCFARGW